MTSTGTTEAGDMAVSIGSDCFASGDISDNLLIMIAAKIILLDPHLDETSLNAIGGVLRHVVVRV